LIPLANRSHSWRRGWKSSCGFAIGCARNAERAALLDKNETARARIEAMISRLKALEQNA
jgi:hypothetical protein